MSLESEPSFTISLPWSPESIGVSTAGGATGRPRSSSPTRGAEVLGSAAAAAAEALEGTQILAQLN